MKPQKSAAEARRVLSLIPASAIVVSSMIGTGIFTTTGLMVAMGGGGGDILLAWLVGGIVALCGGLCYGEIGANLPRSGGEYYYLSVLSLFRLRRRAGIKRVCIGYPITPLIFLAFALWATVWSIRSQPVPTLAALATLLVAYAAHAVMTRMETAPADNIGIIADKLGDSGRNIVRQACEEAKLLNDDQLRAQHALVAISELFQPQFETLLHALSLDKEAVLRALPIRSSQRTNPVEAVRISREFSTMLLEALKHARQSRRRKIEAIDILFGLLADPRGSTAKLFEQLGADRDAVHRQVETLNAVD